MIGMLKLAHWRGRDHLSVGEHGHARGDGVQAVQIVGDR